MTSSSGHVGPLAGKTMCKDCIGGLWLGGCNG